ncbi:MAG: hypothetical protein PHQ23_17135, partial [Candidatus Wallbacteria bacterium]|nr:hypothetical protein [Candidatus Wallbacteria bacterium]
MKNVLAMLTAVLLAGIAFSATRPTTYSNADIYRRNGDCYVMIGDGDNKGVYGPFRESTETIIISKYDGMNHAKYLFSPGNFGKAIAADMFGNVYCLCSDTNAPLAKPRLTAIDLQNLQNANPPYPSMGAVQSGDFYRVGKGLYNRFMYGRQGDTFPNAHTSAATNWTSIHLHSYTSGTGSPRWPPAPENYNTYSGVYSYTDPLWKDSSGSLIIPNTHSFDSNANAYLPNGMRLWIPPGAAHHVGAAIRGTIVDYKERDIKFWDSYYHDTYKNPIENSNLTPGNWDPYNDTFDGFEQVFHTVHSSFVYNYHCTVCHDAPAGGPPNNSSCPPT